MTAQNRLPAATTDCRKQQTEGMARRLARHGAGRRTLKLHAVGDVGVEPRLPTLVHSHQVGHLQPALVPASTQAGRRTWMLEKQRHKAVHVQDRQAEVAPTNSTPTLARARCSSRQTSLPDATALGCGTVARRRCSFITPLALELCGEPSSVPAKRGALRHPTSPLLPQATPPARTPRSSPAKRGALPHAAGDQLERPGGDLLARRRHTNHNALPPSAVRALQRRTHDLLG